MTAYHWIVLFSFFSCAATCIFKINQVLFRHRNSDFAQQRGNIVPAIFYSFSRAMSPLKKETAYLHLPTYSAGIIYHLGTFLSFLWLIFHFFSVQMNEIFTYGSGMFLIISSICGLSIFIKRIIQKKLRNISTPDDYFSNLLVTSFHLISSTTLLFDLSANAVFIHASIIFLYIPLGKLNHMYYFFTSRIHLGILFGRRGTWPKTRREP